MEAVTLLRPSPERGRMLLTVQEAAEELGICSKVVYDLTHRADFPTVKIGRRTLVSREGLAEWVRSQQQNRGVCL